jgi:hypothetical protein
MSGQARDRSRRALLRSAAAGSAAMIASTMLVAPVRAIIQWTVGTAAAGSNETELINKGGGASPDALRGVTEAGGSGLKGEGRFGILGISTSSTGAGLRGQHTGSGVGVNGDSSSGAGVHGNSTSGYGGQFEGGKAQLRLAPASTTGRPTSGSHDRGELYVDSAGSIFLCKQSGVPGVWVKLTTTAA